MKLLQRRCDTMALTSRVRIAVCLALWQHPCPLRLLRRHLSQSERLWHSVTFFSKRKSVSSKTRPLCQGLSCQERLPRPGEVARKCRKGARCLRSRRRGQAQQNETRKRSDTMSLTNRVCIAVRFAFCQHPCPLRRIRASSPKGRASGEEALCISPIHTGIYYTDTTKWVGGNGICLW